MNKGTHRCTHGPCPQVPGDSTDSKQWLQTVGACSGTVTHRWTLRMLQREGWRKGQFFQELEEVSSSRTFCARAEKAL